ncbi:S-layer protein [Thermococcus siculi]|uniref:S-layer protein n=1 Tax=Thermococcus siculi TaxID=72803 RepID=A0A2Z2MHW3_9EURY|nr:PEGA domain-containing protein [Thermococcus siculi]ASJ08012.1 S-layer protein [Thermococcus siculi]
MRWNALLLAVLVAGLLIPPVYSTGENGEMGYLFVEAPDGLIAEISGMGFYSTPVGLALPPGNYTVRIPGNVTVAAQVSVVAGTSTIVRVDPDTIGDAVSGEGIVSIRVTFNESANYSQEKLHPTFDPFAVPSGGCGGGFPYINISKPYPMGLLVRGREEVYITLNGTFMHLGDESSGRACIEYVEVYPGVSDRMENVINATYTVPLARLEIDSTPENLTIYLNGGHNRYIFYTPMGFYVPAIPHDVYNATAFSGFHGTIRIPVIHKLDTHTVGIADYHYLVESVVKVAPNETYHVHVNMEKVKSGLMVERKAVKTVPLEIGSEPSNASVIVTDGVLRAFATTPTTLFLPPGNYTVIASRGNLSAKTQVVLRESSSVLLKLTPANAILSLSVHPENAMVLLDGKEVESGNLTLNPGRYNLTVKAPGYLTKSIEIILAPNESKRVEVSLEKKPAVEDAGTVISPSHSGADDFNPGENIQNEQKEAFNDTQTFTTPPTGRAPRTPGRDNGSLLLKGGLLAGIIAAVYLVLKKR